MYDLSFDWDILILFDFSFLGDVFDLFFWNVLWDVLSQILDGIVVSDGDLSRDLFDFHLFSVLSNFSSFWYSFDSSLFSIFDYLFLEWNVFDSALSFDNFFAGIDDSVND